MRIVPELCRHDDDSVTELHQSMREWGRLLRSFYRERKVGEYKLMKEARSTNDSSHCGDLLAHLIVNSNRALLAIQCALGELT